MEIEKLNDSEIEGISGGIDRENPYALEIWYYNSTTQKERYFHGSYPSGDAAKAAKREVDARQAKEGYAPRLTKIYNALK